MPWVRSITKGKKTNVLKKDVDFSEKRLMFNKRGFLQQQKCFLSRKYKNMGLKSAHKEWHWHKNSRANKGEMRCRKLPEATESIYCNWW